MQNFLEKDISCAKQSQMSQVAIKISNPATLGKSVGFAVLQGAIQ